MAGMANVVRLDPEVRLMHWRVDLASYIFDSAELVDSGDKLIYKEVVENGAGPVTTCEWLSYKCVVLEAPISLPRSFSSAFQ